MTTFGKESTKTGQRRRNPLAVSETTDPDVYSLLKPNVV